ncbi:hypothetical protein B0J14DRAFT_652601 [Halenospora varia]|nr:hypothetical protein B0J14DRAFT_652601 [Halenospora varia]
MAEAARTLLNFGVNVCQYRSCSRSQLPLLHLVIPGPPPLATSGFLMVVKLLLATAININAKDDEGWSAWRVAASWSSYDILRDIMYTYGTCVELDARTDDGVSVHDLSQDEYFCRKLMPNWSGTDK